MATVLEEYTTEEWRFVCFIFGAKGFNAKNIYKKIFLFTVGSVYYLKRLTTGWQRLMMKMLKRRHGNFWDNSQKRLCCEFRRTCKAMGQLYLCWWRIYREINVSFPGSKIICFTSYNRLWPIYWLSIVLIEYWRKGWRRNPLSLRHSSCVTSWIVAVRIRKNLCSCTNLSFHD
jgi:hypothetical protein